MHFLPFVSHNFRDALYFFIPFLNDQLAKEIQGQSYSFWAQSVLRLMNFTNNNKRRIQQAGRIPSEILTRFISGIAGGVFMNGRVGFAFHRRWC